MATERLTVRIGANITAFEKGMRDMQSKIEGTQRKFNDIGGSIQNIGGKIQSVGGSLTKFITMPAVGAATAAAGITAALGWGRLTSLDTAQAQLRGLGYEAEDVDRISENLVTALDGGMMTMAEATSAAATAMAAGVKEGDELTRYIQILDSAVVGGTGTFEEMEQIFGRIVDQGHMTRNEFDMMAQRMPGFSSAVQEHMGISSEEMYEMLRNGEITTDQFLDIMDEFAGGMATEYAKSWEGMVQNTKAYIGILGENLLGGVFEQSKESISEFIDLLSSEEAQEWAADMGEKIGNAFSGIVDAVKGAITWFMDLSSEKQKLIGIIGGVVVAAGPLIMAFGTVLSVVGGMVSNIAPLLGIFGKLAGAFTFLTGPIGLTIAGIAALGAGFVLAYNKSETFRNFIDGLKDKFTDAWGSAMEFKDKVVDAFNGILAIFKGDHTAANELLRGIGLSEENIDNVFLAVTKIQNFFGDMKEGIQTALDGVADFFIEQFQGIKDWWDSDGELILSAITTTFEWAMDAIGDAVQFGLDFVVSLFETFAPIVEGIWNTLWPTIEFIAKNTWSTIELTIGTAMDVIQGIISAVSAIIEGDWEAFGTILKETALSIKDRVVEHFGNMKENAIEFINNLTGGAIDKFIEMKDNLINRAGEIKDNVVGYFSGLKDDAIARVTETYDSVTGWFGDMKTTVTDAASGLKDDVSGAFSTLKDNTIGRAKDAFDGVTGWFSDMWSDTKTTAGNLRDDVSSRFSTMKDNATSRAKDMWSGVTGWFSDTLSDTVSDASSIRDDVSDRFDTMKDNTVDAAKSMWSGVSDFFSDIKDDATSLFSDLVDGAKALPGRIGDAIKNMASHAVDGAKAMGNSLADGLENVINGVIGGLNSLLSKIGMDDPIPEISIARFSTGTGGGRVGAHGNFRTFSTGTRNGRIAEDMLGILNDRGPGNGAGGAVQELIERNGKLLAPQGKDVLVPLKTGDRIYSGAETQSLQSAGIVPRFSRGTGTDGGNSGTEKKGLFSRLGDVVRNVWDFITEPKKAFDAVLNSVTSTFDGLTGFAGKFASGAFNLVKEGGLSFLTSMFERSGGLGTGKPVSFMNYRMTTPYSPNSPVPGYPRSFNNGHHYGIDYATPSGTPVHAPTGGKLSSFWNTGGGKIAKLVTGQLRQFFMHLSSVEPSGSVQAGDFIGRTGNSGQWTTGAHIHWQAQQGTDVLNRNTVNPLDVIGHRFGGIFNKRHFAEIAEDGPEAVIPLSSSKRGRANQIMDSVDKRVGRDDELKMQRESNQLLEKQNNILMQILDKNIDVVLDGDSVKQKIDERDYNEDLMRRLFNGKKSGGASIV